MKKRVPTVGAGFLWSWLYCMWFSRSEASVVSLITGDDVTWLICMTLAAVTQLVVLSQRDRLQSFVLHPTTVLLVGVAMSALSLVFCFTGYQMASVALWVVCIASGALSGILWTAWGFGYGKIDQVSFRLAIPASAIIVLPCMAFCLATSGLVQAVIIAVLPLASAAFLVWMLRLSWDIQPGVELAGDMTRKARSTAIKLGCIAFLACFFLYFGEVALTASSEESVRNGAAGIMTGSVAVALLSLVLLGRRLWQTGMVFLKWLLWFVICAFALAAWSARISCFMLDIAGFAIDFLVILYFVLISHRGYMNIGAAFIIGESLVELGFLFGYVFGFLITYVLDTSFLPLWIACSTAGMSLLLMLLVSQQLNIDFLAAVNRSGKKDGENAEDVAKAFSLSKRETEVFSYLAKGRTVSYISDTLFISSNTVDTHVKHIYAKLGVHSKQELINMVDTFEK